MACIRLAVQLVALFLPSVRGQVCGSSFSLDTDLATGTAGNVRALAYIDDGTYKMLAAGGEDMIIRVWDLSPVSATPRLYKGHHETVWALTYVADLGKLVSASGDGTFRFWSPSVLAVDQPCTGVADCCDGSGLGCEGENVVSWTTVPGMVTRRQIHSLTYVSNGDGTGTFVTGWSDGSLRTWLYDGSSITYGVNLQAEDWDQKDRTYDMVWMSGASVLATASEDWSHPRLWSSLTTAGSYEYLTRGDMEDVCPSVYGHCDAALAIAADSSGTTVASGSRDKKVILWTASTKARVATLEAHTDYVTSLAWMDSESTLASGGADSDILIWDATVTADTTTALETLSGHSGSVNALVWIEGLTFLAAADSAGNVKLWKCA